MDNWQRFNEMGAEKLLEEIKMLHGKLFKLKPNTDMYNQMSSVVAMAQQAYGEKMYMARMEQTLEDHSVINIGEIESHTTTPDYNENIVNVIASSYVSKPRKFK